MEDEDTDFLAGVIEFGDGTQYKIENKADVSVSQDTSQPSDTKQLSTNETAHSQVPVTKEERFGEDIDRSWPRARPSLVHPISSSSVPPRPTPSQHPSPVDGPASGSLHSSHDGTSPTSRVLFNERSNRLEPWSNVKPRLGPPPGPPMTRRDGREDHSPANSARLPPTSQFQGRDVPLHSQPPPGNVQLLQKGVSGPDSPWKGGLPRGFGHGHGPERGRWMDGPGSRGPLRDEEHSPEQRRRDSMSSSDAPGPSTRDGSRGRDGRWETNFIPHGRDIDHGRDRERRNSHVGRPPPPVLPPSLTRDRDRSRDAGLQHLSRMPPPPVPPMRRAPGRDLPSHASHVRPAAVSPSASVRSLVSHSSEQAQSIPPVPAVPAPVDNNVDKDALVKDAMQLAIERAKKRKQEGEAEEKRRLEAAERARKKAEALAAVQEEKKKAEAISSTEKDEQVAKVSVACSYFLCYILILHGKPPTHEAAKLPAEQNGLEVPDKHHEGTRDNLETKPLPLVVPGGRPIVPHAYPSTSPSTLPRRPSGPPAPTPATSADSWRSKAAPVMPVSTRPPKQQVPPPATRPPLPPPTRIPELDLTVQPDENIEVVDFNDLGKLMGASTLPDAPAPSTEPPPTSSVVRPRRPVASDYFDDRPVEPREPFPSFKPDQPSWRRPVSMSTSAAVGEQLRTQTMPIFGDDDQPLAHDTGGEIKSPRSPTSAPQLFKRQSSQGDQASSSSTSQSAHMSPAMLALRSPRMSHFKEAPMSTLTDTMSRIKGALDGMQSQDFTPVALSREMNEKLPDYRALAASPFSRVKVNETMTGSWREQRESRPEISHRLVRSMPKEVFDVTRLAPPRSPKPAWNAFVVKLPKESRPRDIISRKQLHFWNLPHPGVRWDILSWDPPVEGMNKRELSRDEIFHRKNAAKGGKLRVVLPNTRRVNSSVVETDLLSESLSATSRHALVTAAGVKIRLPSGSLSTRQDAAIPSPTPIERPRDSSVPSWRRSAIPLAPLKKHPQNVTSVNTSSPDELNTTSRSPPPEPSTPLPQFANPKSSTPSRPSSTHSATVSLPNLLSSDTKLPLSKRPSGRDVAFFRTSRGDPEADSNKPLPRFTVNSELDSGESVDSTLIKQHTAAKASDESVPSGTDSLIGRSPRGPPNAFLPRHLDSQPESKNSDDSVSLFRKLYNSKELTLFFDYFQRPGTRPVTPPSAHASSAWGKSPLSFSLKDSPARSAPDPEHLKAVWSQASGRPAGSTSNSLKGIADDLPSIPFTVQDMKSEDGETPPPTAPVATPSRLSLQEVTRAFQQVPDTPPQNTSSRPPSYAQTPLLPSGNSQNHRSNQPVAISLPPQHGVRPAFGPYPHTMVGHSPSPTMMYAPGVPSPVLHHRMAVSVPSPPIAHGMWLPTPPPPPSQPSSFMRPAGVPPPPQMMYPSPAPGTAPGVPSQMMHRRMSGVSSGGVPSSSAPSMYHSHPMDMQGHMHAQSPHLGHAHAVGHPVQHMHLFSSPQSGQAPAMYAVPVGAGRGGMVPRPGYDGYPPVPPHSGSYQSVPSTSFVFQS